MVRKFEKLVFALGLVGPIRLSVWFSGDILRVTRDGSASLYDYKVSRVVYRGVLPYPRMCRNCLVARCLFGATILERDSHGRCLHSSPLTAYGSGCRA